MTPQSAKLVRILSLIALAPIVGCIASRPTVGTTDTSPPIPTIKQSLTVGPVVKESLMTAPPIPTVAKSARVAVVAKPRLTRAIFACDVESSPMVGLYGFFEMRTNLTGIWQQAATFPYDGQTHYWTNWFTNSQQCFVRVGMRWPK